MHPAPSVILFSVLSGAGFGLLAFLAAGAALPAGWGLRAVHPLQVPGLDAERHLVEIVRTPG